MDGKIIPHDWLSHSKLSFPTALIASTTIPMFIQSTELKFDFISCQQIGGNTD